MNQPEGSIRSWRDMCEQFVNAFQGGYKRPGTMNDLYALFQEPNEMLRHFMQRFSHVSHNIPEAPDAAIITAFYANVRDVRMRENSACARCAPSTSSTRWRIGAPGPRHGRQH